MPSRHAKPWYRPRNIILGTLALLAATVAAAAVWGLNAQPGAAVDYHKDFLALVDSYQPPATGPDDDARELLDRAAAIVREIEEQILEEADAEGHPLGGGLYLDYGTIADPDLHVFQRRWTLEAMHRLSERGVHELLREIASRPCASPRLDSTLRLIDATEDDAMNRTHRDIRALARICFGRIALARERGDDGEFIAAFEQAVALGRISAQQGTVLSSLTAVAVLVVPLEQAQDWVDSSPAIDPRTGRAILAALDQQMRLVPPYELHLRVDRLANLDLIQALHTDNGRGSGTLLFGSVATLWETKSHRHTSTTAILADIPSRYSALDAFGFFFPSKAATIAKLDEYFDGAIALSRLPASARTADVFDPDAFTDALPMGYVLLRDIRSAKYVDQVDRTDAAVATLRLHLAAAIFRAEHGRHPSSIDDLVPSLLPEPPLDPYTGEPLPLPLPPPR